MEVVDAEVHPIGVEQPFLPAPGHAQPRDQREQARESEAHQPAPSAYRSVVVGEQVLLGPGWSHQWRHPIGDGQVAEEDSKEQQREQDHQDDLGTQHRREHVAVAERVEPQVVGVEAGEPPQRDRADEERHHADEHDDP